MRSAVYSRKRMGPSTDPCGTPHTISVGEDVEEPVQTYWYRPTKYDWNHSDTIPQLNIMGIFITEKCN